MEGSAFQRAGSLGVVVGGEDKGEGSLEKEGARFVVIGHIPTPGPVGWVLWSQSHL